jgi:hypothetical protein
VNVLRFKGGPLDGQVLPSKNWPQIVLDGKPPERGTQHPDHAIRAAYLRHPDGLYHYIGEKSRHEIKIEFRYFDSGEPPERPLLGDVGGEE